MFLPILIDVLLIKEKNNVRIVSQMYFVLGCTGGERRNRKWRGNESGGRDRGAMESERRRSTMWRNRNDEWRWRWCMTEKEEMKQQMREDKRMQVLVLWCYLPDCLTTTSSIIRKVSLVEGSSLPSFLYEHSARITWKCNIWWNNTCIFVYWSEENKASARAPHHKTSCCIYRLP